MVTDAASRAELARLWPPAKIPVLEDRTIDDLEVGDGDEARAGGVIGPDETLVFVVDLVGVRQ